MDSVYLLPPPPYTETKTYTSSVIRSIAPSIMMSFLFLGLNLTFVRGTDASRLFLIRTEILPPSPSPPPPPQQRSHNIDINFMQGVPDTSSIALLTPHQMGVLLTFQPANSQYIKDPVVLTNVRKACLHCLQKINGTDRESEINKKYTNIFIALPFLFLQNSAFTIPQLRIRSEVFKNLIMDDKIDEILVGDFVKKSSTVHARLAKKFNFQQRIYNEADKYSNTNDYGKALSSLLKIDSKVDPDMLINSTKESLPNRVFTNLSHDEREKLYTRVNSNIAATLVNEKILENRLRKIKKNRSPGVDGLSIENLISILYNGNSQKGLKDQIVKEYVIFLKKFLTGDLSLHQNQVFYSLKLIGIPKNSAECRIIMITGLHSKIAFSLVTSSKRKKIVENKLLKYQYGAKRSGSESVIHIIQQILIQNPDYDLFSADAVKAFYKLNRDIALEILKNSFPEVFNMFMAKYNNSADAFVYGTAEGVLKFQQSEGGSPGSPEMSFLYELGISTFINNIADLIRSNDQPYTDKGTIAGFIDDFYWAAPFPKMIEIIQFVQRNGPKYVYTLNMDKCTY